MAPVVILAGDRVLLERRADKGIWGGLWSLPECASAPALAGDASALVMQLLGAVPAGVAPAQPVPLPGFDHALTHFRLRIEPWLVAGDPAWPSDSVAAPDEPASRLRWLPLGECAGAALPQPIKRLLLGLAAGA
jgi:A/G-specific adenine glycosylase